MQHSLPADIDNRGIKKATILVGIDSNSKGNPFEMVYKTKHHVGSEEVGSGRISNRLRLPLRDHQLKLVQWEQKSRHLSL